MKRVIVCCLLLLLSVPADADTYGRKKSSDTGNKNVGSRPKGSYDSNAAKAKRKDESRDTYRSKRSSSDDSRSSSHSNSSGPRRSNDSPKSRSDDDDADWQWVNEKSEAEKAAERAVREAERKRRIEEETKRRIEYENRRNAAFSGRWEYYTNKSTFDFNDRFTDAFFNWLLDQPADTRAKFAYHHQVNMDPARYNYLLGDQTVKDAVEFIKAAGEPKDANYAPMATEWMIGPAPFPIRGFLWFTGSLVAVVIVSFGVYLVFFRRVY